MDFRSVMGDCSRAAGRVRRSAGRHCLVALVFVLSAFAFSAHIHTNAGAQQTEDGLIRQALAEYQAGRIEPAIELLREASKLAPANPYAAPLPRTPCCTRPTPSSHEAQDLMESVQDKVPDES